MTQKQSADCIISADAFKALIFDLDGVITDTASVHSAAWKRMFDNFLRRHAEREGIAFQPFDIQSDYLPYVDGKPRLDGLRSFLESRGIYLPEGTPDDPADADTIQGLGKRKNRDFLKQIEESGVEYYPSTVELIHSAKKHGLKTAVISSSKSCAMILDAVNLTDLFEARVDGVVSEQLGITGKPAPDIFLAAASRLGVDPQQAVVIEDAVSGVQAGRAGKFGRVIGIARTGAKEALLENGADIVVEDLSEIRIAGAHEAARALPSALDDFEKIAARAANKYITVFLDYDGTLCPIVETPEQAFMRDDMRQAVIELARHCQVGIISGRDLADVRDKVRIESIVYAGSHGFDIAGPEGLQIEHSVGEEFLPVLDQAEQALSRKLDAIAGSQMERKRFAIAIHYRRVDPQDVQAVEAIVDEVAAQQPKLRKSFGKKIFELQPRMDWHKGKALFSLLGRLELDDADVLPFYIGDDVTDEDAFRALQGRGIGIVVWDRPHRSAAAYSLRSPDEVREFLLKLVRLCRRSS
jgi:trehalose 6-phosphate phosphatase